MIKVLVADDQDLVRTGFRVILDAECDIEVVGEARDGAEAATLARSLHPDVIVMDIRMPGVDGIAATRQVTSAQDPPRVLILTTFDLDEYVFEALRAGASGFLLKDAGADELLHAVRVISNGDALLAPSVTRRLIQDYAQRPRPGETVTPAEDLTPREVEVLRLIGRGLANSDIARELVVSDATVKTHVSRIFAKLNLHDRAQAVVYAYESGLVQPGG